MLEITTDRTQGIASQIVDDLMAGLSVQLLGVHGSGRSYLARQISAELEFMGVNAMWVHASRALATRPLAALSLSGVDIGGQQGGSDTVLSRGLRSLEAILGQRSSVLIVDDADMLDPASIGLITNVRARRDIPLLMVGAPGDWYKEPYVELLLAAQPGVTVRLREMLFAEITSMAQSILGGVVHTSAISKIAALSGGLPGLVQAIIRVSRRNGRFTFQNEMWTAEGELWDEALRFTLTPFLRNLEERDIASLSKLATIGVASQEQAESLLGRVRVEEFCRRGLLQRDLVLGEGDLTVFPPALAELLVRIRMETEALPERVEAVDPDTTGSVLLVTSREAGILADRLINHWDERIAALRATWEEDKSSTNAYPLVVAILSGMVDEETLGLIREQTKSNADVESYAKTASLLADYRAIGQDDLEGALEELHAGARRLPMYEAHFRSHAAHVTMVRSGLPTEKLLAPADPGASGADLVHLSRAEAMLARGMVNDAMAELYSFQAVDERATYLRQALIELGKVLGGRVAEGVEEAVTHLRQSVAALDPRALSCHAYVAALGMSILGRFSELESVVEIVYRLAEMNALQSYYRVGLFSLGSFAADWEGRREYAHSLALQAKSLAVGSGPFPGMVAGLDLLFRASTTSDQVWSKVDEFLERGYVASAVFLGVAASEMAPSVKRAAKVVEAGLGTQSRALRALTSYVRAAASGDVAAFPLIVAELSEACGPLDVARARITWALLLRERGDFAGWVEQSNHAWDAAGTIDRPCNGLFSRLSAVVDLTSRETEVATSAAQGQASAKIAATIGVSPRTVEKHLQAVYRKTGASNRDELRRILKTWLTV